MHNSPLVYIILLNYNGYHDTIECLKSLDKIKYSNYKIIVVDNSSTDDSLSILEEYTRNTEVKLISSGYNGGFAYGNNVGIQYALQFDPAYILLLNNDTVVDESFLDFLVDFAEKQENVGMVGGKIYYYENTDEVWYSGGYIDKKTARGKHRTDKIGNCEEVEFITGCMQLIPTESLKQVGLMEEDYFLYYEDLDYCKKFINNNYRLLYCDDAKIYHKCGASASYKSPTSIYYSNRARWMYVNKNYSGLKKIYYHAEILFELLLKGMLYKDQNQQAIFKVFKYILQKG